MNRLTENDIIDILAISIVDLHGSELLTKITKMAAELLKHKQLEEELGCPLEVRCEVVPDSYIYTFGTSMETQDVITRRKVITISKEGIYITYATASGKERNMTLSWKGYKKTWWLKEDKSE